MRKRHLANSLTTGCLLGLGSGLLVLGCSSDSGSDFVFTPSVQQPTQVNPTDLTVTASINNSGATDQKTYDRLFIEQAAGSSGSNQGIGFDEVGTIYHAADNSNPGALRVQGNTFSRTIAFDTSRDRLLGGTSTTQTTLLNPKGHDVAEDAGFILIADNGNSSVTVFGTAASGDVPPFGTTITPAAPWDVAYDQANDRLFVAMTDGRVAVYDGFGAGGWAVAGTPAAPSRTITPAQSGGQVSTNLHGIVHDPNTNSLILSDVGDAANTSDGRIFVIPNAATASGLTSVTGVLSGNDTFLGNPVDIDLFATDLRVAEKANDRVLIYTDIYNTVAGVTSSSGNIVPRIAVSQDAPESVASRPTTINFATDKSDLDGSNTLTGVLVTQNDAGNGPILRLAPQLGSQLATFDPTVDVESAKADSRGDVYATTDTSLVVFNRLATGRNNGSFNQSRDRVITGTGLIAAKGLDIVETRGAVIVADFGTSNADSAIRVYGKEAANSAPIFSVATNNGGNITARVWDIDYAPGTDTLYAAFTDGTIGVYVSFFANASATQTPAILTPSGEVGLTNRNCHGIVYDAVNDVLFVSDVGDAASAVDGEIFVINNPGTATGNVTIDTVIAGNSTNLGNPVDLAYDGTNLYVAEKSNGMIMRFDNIRGLVSGNFPASATFAQTSPESVCPLRE